MNKTSIVAFAVASILASAAASAASSDGLDEIVVTATKREQTLQDVPVAVTVTSAQTIRQTAIRDVLDLQSVVPSLRVSQLQTSTQTNFIIRGFGNGANNPGIESSVGVFVDGVYRSRSASQIGDLVDVERIEVLRGPQSTLFGQNASAGVVSIVTRKPSFTPGGSLEASFGNYNSQVYRGYVTAPLNEKVAFSLSGNYNKRNGYFENLATGNSINDRNRYDLRGQLLANVSDSLTARLIVDYSSIDETCCGVSNLVNGPTGGVIAALGGKIYAGGYADRKGYFNTDPVNDVKNRGASLHLDWKSGALTVSSITALRGQSATFNYDSDFTSTDLLPTNINDQQIRTFTQELRASFDNGGKVSGVAGAYYFNESVAYDNTLGWGTSARAYASTLIVAKGGSASTLPGLEAATGLPTGTFFKAGSGGTVNTNQDNKAYTLFGQLDWKLADKMTLTTGIAYTNSKKVVDLAQTNSDAFAQLNLVQIGFAQAFGALTGGKAATPANFAAYPAQAAMADKLSVTGCTAATGAACNSALALYELQFLTPVVPYTGGETDDGKATYTLRLAYDFSDNIKVYGGVSTGFKASSWNLSRDSKPLAPATGDRSPLGGYANPYYGRYGSRFANPEESTVMEVGFKGRWTHSALNIAVFNQEIKGFQSNIFTGTGFSLQNAGKQTTKGAEVEWMFAPTKNWEFNVATTFLDPNYDSFPNAQGPTGTVDLTGTKPAGIAATTASIGGAYRWEFGSYEAFVRGDYHYESNVQVVENITAAIASREVKTLNASAGVSRSGWDFMVFARNLNNDSYLISAFPPPAQSGSFSGYPSMPRTWGATIRKVF
jgi:outer membrane receptor protein involved in Fe transport